MENTILIRNMQQSDMESVISMMRTFYASPAVLSDGSEEIFRRDAETCILGSPYLEGYVFEVGADICGYAMVAKSFSTEFGKSCIWIEDLYVSPDFRKEGLGGKFLKFITEKYDGCIFRLEVEEYNQNAVRLYKKFGFEVLPYLEMKR